MNSAALLDLLGNENRRRILRLLAQKPCYVTEISDYLGVSPKAVIDHLRKLEEAGLVESRVDDQRRKYFHIARNLRLEVNVSPHRFGAKSAYPASTTLDLTRCRHVSIDFSGNGDASAVEDGTEPDAKGGGDDRGRDEEGAASDETDDSGDPAALARELRQLEELEEELSLAQRVVQARLDDTLDRLAETVDGEDGFDNRLFADVLLALQDGASTTRELGDRLEAHPELVEDVLARLADEGVVDRDPDGWTIAG